MLDADIPSYSLPIVAYLILFFQESIAPADDYIGADGPVEGEGPDYD